MIPYAQEDYNIVAIYGQTGIDSKCCYYNAFFCARHIKMSRQDKPENGFE